MTVAELISELQKLPQHAQVFTAKVEQQYAGCPIRGLSPGHVLWEGNHVRIEPR